MIRIKLTFLILFNLATLCLYAQEKSTMDYCHPDSLFHALRTADEKLVILYFFDAASGSVTFLKELNRTTEVYKTARLKGGRSGLRSIVILYGEITGLYQRLLTQKFNQLHFVELNDLPLSTPVTMAANLNFLWDSNGHLLAKNSLAEQIFSTVQQLITR